MKVDILHNKIVKETITESFIASVNENLVPKLYDLYGDSIDCIQMYEDYIKDEFVKEGYMYYPLSLSIGGVNAVLWIMWDISDKKQFKGGIPYSYIGNGVINFEIADDVPVSFKETIAERANYYESGLVKTEVCTDAQDASVLIGRYSQTFIDELSRQMTREISKACGVLGLSESSIELSFVFAPNTYMEHTSENVTYRRLLISAKGCAPRDFWVKWTRLNSSSAFTVTDVVKSDDIRFEIGEDVSHKIREKEYRFLVYGNSDKYRVAMGRKNITEWRELIKRSVKRGELEKTTTALEEEARVSEISDKLSQILEKCGVAVPAPVEIEVPVTASTITASDDSDAVNEALRMAVLSDSDYKESEEEPSKEIPVTETYISNASEDDGEFDFDEHNTTFEIPISEDSEIEMALEEAFPDFQDISDNDDAEAEFSLNDSYADIEESESEHFEINKNLESKENFVEEDESDEAEYASEDEEDASDEAEYASEDEEDASDEAECASEDEEDASDEAECASEDEEDASDEAEYASEDEEAFDDLESNTEGTNESEVNRLGEEISRLSEEIAIARRREESERMAKEDAEENLNIEKINVADLRAQVEKQRAAIAEIKALLERETGAKKLAEAEADRLRTENENTAKENDRLAYAARSAEDAWREAELKNRESEEKLLQQIELYEKQKVREKLLVAEAARQVREEIERELAENEKFIDGDDYVSYDEEPDELDDAADAYDEALDSETKEDRIAAAKERAEELRRKMEDDARREADLKFGGDDEAYESGIPEESEEIFDDEDESDETGAAELTCEDAEDDANEIIDEVIEEKAEITDDVSDVSSLESKFEENLQPEFAKVNEEVYTANDINYTYVSKTVRILFKNVIDQDTKHKIREMIAEALEKFGRSDLYMKVKATSPDNTSVVLNFVEYPQEETQLLIDIIYYLGNGNLGIYKIILE